MNKQQAQKWIEKNGHEDLFSQHVLEYMVECIQNRADWPYSHTKDALVEILDIVVQSNSESYINIAIRFADNMSEVIRIGNNVYYIDDIEN